MKRYVTYLTVYIGELLPKYYIGSTSEDKIISGNYFGSVKSKKWKSIFRNELKKNKHLFSVQILSYHNDRKSALEEELRLQKEKDVVRSKDYINESLATPNGFFGMDTKGEKSPTFGNKMSDESKKKMSLANKGKSYEEIYGKETANKLKLRMSERFSGDKNPMYGISRIGTDAPNYGNKMSDESRKKMSDSQKGNRNRLGKESSEKTRNILSELNKGEKNPRYKEINFSLVIGFIKKGKTNKEICELFGISICTFRNRFKEEMGISIKEYRKKYE